MNMMRVRDRDDVVHAASTSPGRNPHGDVRAGITACGRWYIWESMAVTYQPNERVMLANHAGGAVTCLGCAR